VSAIGSLLSLTMVAQTARMAVPYVAAATGGVLSERSGVVNIALEGTMLVGAFGAVTVHLATGSPWLGLLGGAAFGAVFAATHALIVVYGRVSGIVSGIALNLLAAAGTRFFLRALYGSSSNSPPIAGFRVAALEGSGGWARLGRVIVDPTTLAVAIVAILVALLVARTVFGLRLRAAGEAPAVARSSGIDVGRTRLAAVTLGGVATALGGASLAFDQHQFQAGMSSGRGFIALAAVVLSGWNVRRAALFCVVFAVLDAVQVVLQNETRLPVQVLSSLPYAATLVAMVVVLRRGESTLAAPAGLDRHAD